MSDQEKHISQANKIESDQEEQLNNFLNLLTGNKTSPDSQNQENSLPNSPTDSKKSSRLSEGNNSSDRQEQEMEILQQLLGKSEIEKVKDRLITLEDKCVDLEQENSVLKHQLKELNHKLEKQKETIDNFLPILSKTFDTKLGQLRKEMLIDISTIVEKLVRDHTQQPQKLSIQVIGLRKEAQSE